MGKDNYSELQSPENFYPATIDKGEHHANKH